MKIEMTALGSKLFTNSKGQVSTYDDWQGCGCDVLPSVLVPSFY